MGLKRKETAAGWNRLQSGVRKLAGRSPFDEVEGWYEGVAAKKATDVLLGFLTETSISANAPA